MNGLNKDKEVLRVSLKYKDLEAEINGDFDNVWRYTNDFFREIKKSLFTGHRSSIIHTDGKTVPEILIALRDNGFFNGPKSSKKCYNKLKELGRTDITQNAVSMALKNLVKKGELKRMSEGRSFNYIAPYIDLEGD